VAPFAGQAQSPKRIYRVGYITVSGSQPRGPAAELRKALVEGLRELGYVEGENLVMEWRAADGRPERLPQLAADLVSAKVDVIVSTSDVTHVVLQRATRTLPVVMLISSDPVGRGVAASLARPGGNFTGLASVVADLYAKQLEVLRELLPQATRIVYLHERAGEIPVAISARAIERNEATARQLGFALRPLAVRSPVDLEAALASIAKEGAQAVHVSFSPFTYRHRREIAEAARHAGLPTVSASREFVEAGGLISYGVDLPAAWHRGAHYVDRILKGAPPGEIPIEQPARFELVVNASTAKALRLTLPPSLLLRATAVLD